MRISVDWLVLIVGLIVGAVTYLLVDYTGGPHWACVGFGIVAFLVTCGMTSVTRS
jgi:1,4-dihydroxy-2-naphthoate octaprenyltransferase